jgi:micrococcal nuclease
MTPYFLPPTIGICHVNRVMDGDTFECDKLKIRICGADAPEKFQPYGAAATHRLTKLVLNKNVRLVTQGNDIYARVLAEVWINNRFINAELIRSGLAYIYGTCPTQKTVLINAEKSAIANKLGVWQAEQIRPWVFRQYKND